MTAKTSQRLADALRAAGFDGFAKRAEADEFHDFLANAPLPQMVLADELASIVRNVNLEERVRLAAHHIRDRLINGEFDASEEEGDEWAASEDGRAAFAEFLPKEPKQ
jgi:hypothetical protein